MLIGLLVATFLGFVVIGVPIAFAMGLASIAFLMAEGNLPLALVAQRLFSGIDSFPLMAVPFFIFAGLLMDVGGISARLVALAKALVGHIRGGLAMVVMVAEVFFSGISGSTTADISAIGSTLIPAMRRAGYTPAQAAAIVAAASSMGVLIPPCIMMVVLGSLVNISIGDLFLAGFLPSAVMAFGLMVLVYWQARRGILPPSEEKASRAKVFKAVKESTLAMLMPVIIFGGIIAGIATPTEIAAVGALYAVVVSVFIYKEVDWRGLGDVFERTVVLTGAALALIGLATTFSWILASQQVPAGISNLMTSIGGGVTVFLLLSTVVFLLAGVFLEGLPALIVLMPILLPVAQTTGIDSLHYSILAIGAVGVGIFLPPIGIGLLLSADIAGVGMGRVSRAFMPYLGVLLLSLVVIALVPWITTIVPDLLR
ncbi:TRAP transporter large permease [Leptospira interrogans]